MASGRILEGRRCRLGLIVTVGLLTLLAPSSSLALSSANNTPFRTSTVIAGAAWTSARHGPPANQFGDILSTTWADDGNLYVLMDDGGTDSPGNGALWRNSFARVAGSPLNRLRFARVGVGPPAATPAQIAGNASLWSGPLGSYYATGLTSVDHVFYATQTNDWDWNDNGPFDGLAGIAYSTDHGQRWQFPSKPFPGPTGNLNWVQQGRDAVGPDGYAYAISTDREFNASELIIGRSRPKPADMTNPAHWQWDSEGVSSRRHGPVWSSSIVSARPILSWSDHITYPRMSYDPPLRRYLLTFTYSYGSSAPAIWQDGSELVILEAPRPWGPFAFVASGPYFGPSNGYDPAFPVKWISPNGLDLWMIWAANFDGCAPGLNCSAGYGFNYQRLALTLTTRGKRRIEAHRLLPDPVFPHTHILTPPPFGVPRLFISAKALAHLATTLRRGAGTVVVLWIAIASVLLALAIAARVGARRRARPRPQ